jgi:hypothetical protein
VLVEIYAEERRQTRARSELSKTQRVAA